MGLHVFGNSTSVLFYTRTLAYKVRAVRMRRKLCEHYVYHYIEYGRSALLTRIAYQTYIDYCNRVGMSPYDDPMVVL
jgi:hypothetical protein